MHTWGTAGDWRAWACLGSIVAIGVLDLLLPPDIVVLPLMIIPIVGSATLGRPALTAASTVVAILMGMWSTLTFDYPPVDAALRIGSLAGAGLVAVFLATGVVAGRRRLAQSRDQFRRFATLSADVFVLGAEGGQVIWISDSVSGLLGWRPDQVVGRDMADLMHPDDMATLRTIQGRMRQGEDVHYQARLATSAGGWRWIELNVGPSLLTDGEFQRIGTWRDIQPERDAAADLVTAREKAETDRVRMSSLIDTMFDPYVLFVPVRDDAGEIVDFLFGEINDAACAFNHTTREEALGRSIGAFMPQQVARALVAQNARVLETGEPLVLDDFSFPDDEHVFDVRSVRAGDAVGSTWRDVTARHREVEAVRESELSFRLLAENSTDVVMHVRGETVVWVSPSLRAMLGWEPEDWTMRTLRDFVEPDDISVAEAIQLRVDQGEPVVARLRMRASSGSYHWIEFHARPYLDEDGEVDGAALSFRTIDREVLAERELERRARYDDLTGMLKRSEALDRLHEIGQHVRRPGDETAGLFIDVDDFKSVNDRWGHAAGDALLQALADRIHRIVRAGDTVARMGGDEFLVILEGLHSMEEATAVAEKIRLAAQEPVATRDGEVSTTVSIGVTMSSPIETADDMVTRADQAMYEAKRSGRNRVVTVPLGETSS